MIEKFFSGTMNYQRVAGARQLQVKVKEDLDNILKLDEAHWALTSIPVEAVCANQTFLDFLDSDHNGIIRTDELQNAVRFVLSSYKDFSALLAGNEILQLDALNEEDSAGSGMKAAAKLILEGLGCADSTTISLEQAQGKTQALTLCPINGDGIIPPAAVSDEKAKVVHAAIMKLAGTQKDLSGEDGISMAEIDKFLADIEKARVWHQTEAAVQVFGAETAAISAEAADIAAALDDYFLACETAAYYEKDDIRINKNSFNVDIQNPEEYRLMLEKSTIAQPGKVACLDLNMPVNPLYRGRISKLASRPELAEYFAGNVLTKENWGKLNSALAPFRDWQKNVPAAGYGELTFEQLDEYSNEETITFLRNRCLADAGVAAQIDYCDSLQKLLYFQKYLVKFLNNTINLSELFRSDVDSVLQAGKLVLDGRHFTLTEVVTNIADHKKIVQGSNICVIYVEITFGKAPAIQKKNLAVAVTSGNVRNLFPGKRGIFFATDGTLWDAKIIDMITQPVSVVEALQMPFIRMGEFVTKQADKFFSTQSNTAQQTLAKDLSSGKIPAAPPAAPKAQTPAVSGSMVLMGGGLGIAAIGSSIAFMIKSLQNISITSALLILLGILLIFGGPVVAISLVKLFRRNMSRYLEANAFAVNRPMRLSQKMGRFFTYQPHMPHGKMPKFDILDHGKTKKSRIRIWFIIAFLVVALAYIVCYYYFFL